MFYDNYVRLCNSIGKSPSAVAVELGLKKATVTRWKKGGNPTDANAQKIADYFNVTTEFLFGIEEQTEKAPAEDDERKVSDDDIKFALFGTREIDDDVLDRVKQFAKFAQENEKNK
ncbi:MAG: helix-turn-helix domain-containing protein [Oscillospiraceae bacterium]